MHPCRECGKPVETTAQFCPWCFALPGTVDEGHARPEPLAVAVPGAVSVLPPVVVPAAPPPAPVATWGGAPVTSSRWPRILVIGGSVAFVVALVAGVLMLLLGRV